MPPVPGHPGLPAGGLTGASQDLVRGPSRSRHDRARPVATSHFSQPRAVSRPRAPGRTLSLPALQLPRDQCQHVPQACVGHNCFLAWVSGPLAFVSVQWGQGSPVPDAPCSVALQTPDCWPVASAGQEPGSRRWPSGYDSFISFFQSPAMLISLHPPEGSCQEGKACGPPPLKEAQTKVNCPRPPGCHNSTQVALSELARNHLQKRSPGALGTQDTRSSPTWPGRGTVSLLRLTSPSQSPPAPGPEPELPRKVAWARGPQRPGGAPMCSGEPVSQCHARHPQLLGLHCGPQELRVMGMFRSHMVLKSLSGQDSGGPRRVSPPGL